MDIAHKTRTRIMHQIMSALGVPQVSPSEGRAVILHNGTTIEDLFEWHTTEGVYDVSTMIHVNVTKTRRKD